MNMAFLVGRLVRDPELQTIEGKKRTKITVAVGRPFKNSDGIYEADYINCTVWNVIAERLCEYCHKGDMLTIKARIQNNNYTDKDNKKVYTYDFVCEQISFMQNAKDSVDLATCES